MSSSRSRVWISLCALFFGKKREAEGCRSTWTVWATLPHLFAATSSGWDPLVGPHRHVFEVGTQWWDHIATSSRWDLLVGPRCHVLEVVHEPNDLWRFSFVVLWRFFCFCHYSSCQRSVTCYLWRSWKFRHRKRLFCDEICKRHDWIVIDEHISSSANSLSWLYFLRCRSKKMISKEESVNHFVELLTDINKMGIIHTN